MARARSACQSCSLPFYTDDNARCPYCGQGVSDAGPAGPTLRERVTCDRCGLAYYADENDACPYCASADRATAAGAEATDDSATTAADDGAERAATGREVAAEESGDGTRADDGPSSVVGSLLRPLRRLFGG